MSSLTVAWLFDGQTASSRLFTSALTVVGALVVMVGLRLLFRWRIRDAAVRYHTRKITNYALAILALIGLGLIWRPFAGQLGLVVGLLGAGLAFALQEVIGALAGWANIISGGIFRVGDRVELAGVQGDVIDITLLRTKLMEIGSPVDGATWVRGRQYTGRIVAVSNKKTFTEPVFNFSATFEFIWEELTIPVSHDADWALAESIMLEEAQAASASEGAQEAMKLMLKRYPVPRTEVAPYVFVRVTDNWMELAARFIVPVRSARSVKDGLARRIKQRLDEAGIEIASQTIDATLRRAGPGTGRER